jgi:hypothetical protein
MSQKCQFRTTTTTRPKKSPGREVSAQPGPVLDPEIAKVRVAVVSASSSESERPPRTSKTLSLTTAIRCSARTTSETKSPASRRG